MSTTCEGGLGAARPSTTDIASQYVTADKPEATATFTLVRKLTPIYPPHPKPLLLTLAMLGLPDWTDTATSSLAAADSHSVISGC